MGYYVSGYGTFRIAPEREADALTALHALNQRNDLKRGGRYVSGVTKAEQQPRHDGPNPDIWFSWLDWNYHETTDSVDAVLEHLGFDVETSADGTRSVSYDNKTGAEDVFLAALGPFVDAGGFVEWSGEDDRFWRDEFTGTDLVQKEGRVVYD